MVKRKIFLQLVIANFLIKSAYFLISQYSDKIFRFYHFFISIKFSILRTKLK
jgi:hypothetical protein